MDVARNLMLAIADAPGKLDLLPDLAPVDRATVAFHAALLVQAGFVEAIDIGDKSEPDYARLSLTWAGHEFLDTVRDPQIWSSTKAATKKVGSWSISLVAELAKGALMAKVRSLGLPLGD